MKYWRNVYIYPLYTEKFAVFELEETERKRLRQELVDGCSSEIISSMEVGKEYKIRLSESNQPDYGGMYNRLVVEISLDEVV